MNKNWFELTKNKKNINGKMLTQIRYLKKVGNKSQGSLGGYVFNEDCLVGECELDETTFILDGCTIGYCCLIDSIISNNTHILGNKECCEYLKIENSEISFSDISFEKDAYFPENEKPKVPSTYRIQKSEISGSPEKNLIFEIQTMCASFLVQNSTITSSYDEGNQSCKFFDITVFGFASLTIKDSNVEFSESENIVVTSFANLNIIQSNLCKLYIHTILANSDKERTSFIRNSNLSGQIICEKFDISNSEIHIKIDSTLSESETIIDETTGKGFLELSISKKTKVSEIKKCNIEGDCLIKTTGKCSSFLMEKTKIEGRADIVFEKPLKMISECDLGNFSGETSLYDVDIRKCVLRGKNDIQYVSFNNCSITDCKVGTTTINDCLIPTQALSMLNIDCEIITKEDPLMIYCFESSKLYYAMTPKKEYEIVVDKHSAKVKSVSLVDVFKKHATNAARKNNNIAFNTSIDVLNNLHERIVKYNLKTLFDNSTKYSLVFNLSRIVLLTIARLCYISENVETIEISGVDSVNFVVLSFEMEESIIINVKTKKVAGFDNNFVFLVSSLKILPGCKEEKFDSDYLTF